MKRLWRRVAPFVVKLVLSLYAFWIGSLILFRWVTPPTTGVHIQRRVETCSGETLSSQMEYVFRFSIRNYLVN